MKSIILFFAITISTLSILSCSELKEDLTTTSPNLSVHKEGFTNPASPNFHANVFVGINAQTFSDCAQCHASNFSGGITKAACTNCHSSINVHQDGILNPHSPDFHGKFIASNLGWDSRECGTCHSSDYSGGIASPSCLNCHTSENGPEACNTCHGDFSDPTKIAPPRALNGSLETTYAGVGAHNAHLYDNNLGSEIPCLTCHNISQSVYTAGHLGTDGKAEINFSGLSNKGGVNPNYSFTNNTCSDTYCHGNFVFYKDSSNYAFAYTAATMVGSNFSPKWNQADGTQAQCGSCHGLPPVGHTAAELNTCVNCHQGVINAQGEIIDPSKHINGVKNVFGN